MSEDSFDYFRCWLIAQGREVFEGAVHHPDDLADLVPDFDEDEDGDAEEFGYAADEAHEQLTGLPLPDLGNNQPRQPEGAPFDDRDPAVLAKRFPSCGRSTGIRASATQQAEDLGPGAGAEFGVGLGCAAVAVQG